MFGKVVDGLDIVKKMESFGSAPHGVVSKRVFITDCGAFPKVAAPAHFPNLEKKFKFLFQFFPKIRENDT